MKGASGAFHRSRAFASALMALASLPLSMQREAAAKLGNYKSRGKGRGRGDAVEHPKLRNRSKYTPQGRIVRERNSGLLRGLIRIEGRYTTRIEPHSHQRENERRLRHMAAGWYGSAG